MAAFFSTPQNCRVEGVHLPAVAQMAVHMHAIIVDTILHRTRALANQLQPVADATSESFVKQ